MVNDSLQSPPHEIPAGLEVMVPVPVPDLVMVRGWVEGVPIGAKVAVTAFCLLVNWNVQVDEEPTQEPVHARKVHPGSGTAVRVILVVAGISTEEHVGPQFTPPGPVTVPEPVFVIV